MAQCNRKACQIAAQAERMLPILQARKLISPEAPLHSCADLARVVTWDK